MKSLVAPGTSRPQMPISLLSTGPSEPPLRNRGLDVLLSSETGESRSDFEISTTSASASIEEDVSTAQNSIDSHVAAIIRARKAIREAIDKGSDPMHRSTPAASLESAEALIRARQLLRLEKSDKKDRSVLSTSQNSNHFDLTAPVASNQIDLVEIEKNVTSVLSPSRSSNHVDDTVISASIQSDLSASQSSIYGDNTATSASSHINFSKSGSSVMSETSSTECTDGSSMSNIELSSLMPSLSEDCHPDEVEIVVPKTPSLSLVDDKFAHVDVCQRTGKIEPIDILHTPFVNVDLEPVIDVEKTSNCHNESGQKASSEYLAPTASSEEIAAGCGFPDSGTTHEPGLPENPSLTTTDSLDGINSEVLKQAALKVRDFIDDMPLHQQLEENSEKQSSASMNESVFGLNTNALTDVEMPTNYLFTYLSSQIPEPGRQDPPSLDDFQSAHLFNDPPMIPIAPYVSQEPEVNPKKDKTTVHDLGSFNSFRDPEIKKVFLHDELGELNFPLSHESIKSLDSEANHSIPIDSENVNESPKRRVTLLTIPNMFDESDRSSQATLDPDGFYPAHRDYTAATRNLYVLLSGVDDATEQDVHLFGQLIRFSYPFFLNSSDLSAFADSQILTYAKEHNVSMVLVDRFLDTIHNIQGDILGKYDNLESLKEMTLLVQDLCAHIEVESDNGEDVHDDDPNFLILNQTVPSDAFEIEANNGFVSKEYHTSDDEEPWWEVAARLNGKSCLDELHNRATNGILAIPSDCGVINDAQSNDKVVGEKKPNNTVENEISDFWKDREEFRLLETEKLKSKGPKLRPLIARNDRNIGKASSFSHVEASKEFASLSGCKTCSDSSVRSMPHLSLREIQQQWSSKLAMADGTVTTAKSISAVDATFSLQKKNVLQDKFPFSNLWRNSYEKLTENHEGFFDVDIYSLYASTVVGTTRHTLDNVPWESRPVKQRFLYEQSLSFTRNWFGCLTATYINPRIKEPVCRPKSMEMPMAADEWTEEWYKLSKSRSGSVKLVESSDDSDVESWEDAPECGKIKTMRLRPGERISRLTPDLTCYLRRSRWRKKHFPEGNFPYV